MKTIPLGKISNTESLDNKNIDNSNLGSSNNGKQQAAIDDKNSSSFNNVKVNVQSTQAIGQNLNNENSEGMKIFLNNFNLKIENTTLFLSTLLISFSLLELNYILIFY